MNSIDGVTLAYKENNWMTTFRSMVFIAIGFSIPLSTAAISITFVLLFVLWLFDRNFCAKLQELCHNPVLVAVVAFFMLHLVGQYWLETTETVNGFKSWMIFLIPVLATAVDTKTAKRGVYAFVVAMMIAESWVYLNILQNWEAYVNLKTLESLVPYRFYISGSRISYNPMLAFAIALLLTTILAGYYRSWRLFVAIGFLITMILNMFMTEGRAGHVAFIFIWIVLSIYFFRDRWALLIGMLGSLVIIITLAFSYSPVFKNRVMQAQNDLLKYQTQVINNEDFKGTDTSLGVRLHYTEWTFRKFLEKPWLGFGTGSFEYAYGQQVEKYQGKIRSTTNPHNYHVLILIQFGLLGISVYGAIFVTQLLSVRSMPVSYEYRSMALLLPLFYGLINMYDTYMWSHQLQALFAYVTSIFYRRDMWNGLR